VGLLWNSYRRSPLLRALYLRVIRSRRVAHALFGVDFGPVSADDYYFDITTWALARHLRTAMPPGARVVDMGTGAVAAMAQIVAKRTRRRVIAVDVNPTLAASAEASVRQNAADVRVVCSDLFSSVDEPFDLVLFNPPYVPTREGQRRGLSPLRQSQWDGGHDGTAVLDRFIAAFRSLPVGTRALVALNRRHVSRARMRQLLAESTLAVDAVHSSRLLPVDIYDLRAAGPASGT
jgi:release factor glutamine methyltransferase